MSARGERKYYYEPTYMDSEQKQNLHNEVVGMFRGYGSRHGSINSFISRKDDNKRSKQPTLDRGQGTGATGVHSEPRPNSGNTER